MRLTTLYGVRSKSLKLGRHNHFKEEDEYKYYRKIQAATAVVIVLREVDVGTSSGTSTASLREARGQRHGGLGLKQPSVDTNVADRYVELLNFEMKVTNIPQAKTYELKEDEKVPILKKLVRQRGSPTHQNFHEAGKMVRGLFATLGDKFKLYHSHVILSLQYF